MAEIDRIEKDRTGAASHILEVDGIELNFGAVRSLDAVSLKMKAGEILSIIGPNGAGKTSLLNCINGFYHPQKGQITFMGKVRKKIAANKAAAMGIARTFQNLALFGGMTTLDNLMSGRNLMMKTNVFQAAIFVGPTKREEAQHREKVEEIIYFLELEAVRDTAVAGLPYGLQKRVEFGRAIAAEPDLILLDEPMAGMKHDEKAEMSNFVRKLNAQGMSILLIEHDIGVVTDISDHVVVLDNGRKISEGEPQVVVQDPRRISRELSPEG